MHIRRRPGSNKETAGNEVSDTTVRARRDDRHRLAWFALAVTRPVVLVHTPTATLIN